jgi:hypothetical protein
VLVHASVALRDCGQGCDHAVDLLHVRHRARADSVKEPRHPFSSPISFGVLMGLSLNFSYTLVCLTESSPKSLRNSL